MTIVGLIDWDGCLIKSFLEVIDQISTFDVRHRSLSHLALGKVQIFLKKRSNLLALGCFQHSFANILMIGRCSLVGEKCFDPFTDRIKFLHSLFELIGLILD